MRVTSAKNRDRPSSSESWKRSVVPRLKEVSRSLPAHTGQMQPLLFLLDELFSGTNSEDRRHRTSLANIAETVRDCFGLPMLIRGPILSRCTPCSGQEQRGTSAVRVVWN